ncbi:hypothetical protein FHX08_001200 [Rhizobium sp. BK529]|uniref:hypothetical protein n=1 Tax=unclassified Rhizobium TaxID=2613769 RepID=UPI00104619D9|nr:MULTISPECIES: hypothetical protein [unclassified Rhizobium]MBB3590856.1 hypothetical protein [Rhizobium sp. BK529]TCS09189.1 hypothetical protein EV281_1011070 [Rhizobium sp. BK418]
MRISLKSRPLPALLLSSLSALAACQSSAPPTPDQMSRNTVETAPADLQLLCADAAAKQAGLDRAKILPTGSRPVEAGGFSVDLDASGRKFACVIDRTGVVRSVLPA